MAPLARLEGRKRCARGLRLFNLFSSPPFPLFVLPHFSLATRVNSIFCCYSCSLFVTLIFRSLWRVDGQVGPG